MFGVPKIIVTDGGTELVNNLMKHMHNAVGVDHRVTAPYNARANGKNERWNQSLMESLRCHCESNPRTWPKALTWFCGHIELELVRLQVILRICLQLEEK